MRIFLLPCMSPLFGTFLASRDARYLVAVGGGSRHTAIYDYTRHCGKVARKTLAWSRSGRVKSGGLQRASGARPFRLEL
jgi:hypothetical protein